MQVVGREWRHYALLNEAFITATPPGALVAKGVRVTGEPEPDQGEETWRLWWQAPDRLRTEFAVGTERRLQRGYGGVPGGAGRPHRGPGPTTAGRTWATAKGQAKS